MSIEMITGIISTALGVAAAVLTLVLKLVKSETAKKKVEKALELTELLGEVMSKAETSEQPGTVKTEISAAKKAEAEALLRAEADKRGLFFDETYWSGRIEALIEMSKTVNAKN